VLVATVVRAALKLIELEHQPALLFEHLIET
jgi:hypothetical protein